MCEQPNNGVPVPQVICPKCEDATGLEDYICEHCGFPLLCDIAPHDDQQDQGVKLQWRIILGVVAIVFWLTNGVFVHQGYNAYHGLTATVVARLTSGNESAIPISGPPPFVLRTKLALDLLKQRSPSFYFRVQQRVTAIDYLGPSYLETEGGKRISLERIGAVSTPSTGQVQVLYSTAFPRGVGEITDYDIFSYAGVLVHELRHIELHDSGQSPGGWEEEVICEEAAYECLKFMGAPGGVLVRYNLYLQDPHAKRYQHWYDWYKQW